MRKLIVLGLLLVGSQASADEAVTVHGGWMHTASSAYGDAATGSMRYEHRLWQDLWIGPEYTYHGPMDHHTGHDDGTGFSYGDVSGHSLLADLVYYPSQLNWREIQPYAIAGAGWSWWDFEESARTMADGITVDLGDSFAYKVGLGATKPINKNWSFLVEWSFFKSLVPKDAVHADGSYSAILGDDKATGRVRIGEEEFKLTAGLKYSW